MYTLAASGDDDKVLMMMRWPVKVQSAASIAHWAAWKQIFISSFQF